MEISLRGKSGQPRERQTDMYHQRALQSTLPPTGSNTSLSISRDYSLARQSKPSRIIYLDQGQDCGS